MGGGKQAEETRITYADAGVDISAGNALVEAIKPLARATARSGTDSALGGFGGLFDLKAAGFRDPVLVAGTDGVARPASQLARSADGDAAPPEPMR